MSFLGANIVLYLLYQLIWVDIGYDTIMVIVIDVSTHGYAGPINDWFMNNEVMCVYHLIQWIIAIYQQLLMKKLLVVVDSCGFWRRTDGGWQQFTAFNGETMILIKHMMVIGSKTNDTVPQRPHHPPFGLKTRCGLRPPNPSCSPHGRIPWHAMPSGSVWWGGPGSARGRGYLRYQGNFKRNCTNLCEDQWDACFSYNKISWIGTVMIIS